MIRINLAPQHAQGAPSELGGARAKARRVLAQTGPRASSSSPRSDARGTSPSGPWPLDVLERIDALSAPEPNTGCFWFIGDSLTDGGYPRVRVKGRFMRAHRIVLEAKLGRRLPRRIFACHTCDNRLCVNPAHLFPGSNRANVRDKVAKGRQARVAHGGVVLDLERARDIRAAKAAGETTRAIAARFGVSVRQAQRVLAGQRWCERPAAPALEAAE